MRADGDNDRRKEWKSNADRSGDEANGDRRKSETNANKLQKEAITSKQRQGMFYKENLEVIAQILIKTATPPFWHRISLFEKN